MVLVNTHRTLRCGAVFGILALVVAGCGSSSSKSGSSGSGSTSGTPLVGTQWVLASATDLGVPTTGVAVTAEFAGGSVTGDSGCNTYRGRYQVDGAKLTIGPDIASTRIACTAGPTAVETAYLARLPRVTTFAIKGSTLTLSGAGGKTLLVYDAIDGAKAIAGDWNATSYYTGTAIESVITGSTPTATFADGHLSGNGGCNGFTGDYTLSGSATIKIGPLVSTLMACADAAVQTQEQHYLAALQLATAYRVTPTTLELLRPGGTIAATFQRG